MMRRLLLPLLLTSAAAVPNQLGSAPVPLLQPRGEVIPGSYIVKFKEGTSTASFNDALGVANQTVDRIYNHVFHGFASRLDNSALHILRSRSDIDFIEADGVINVNGYVEQPDAPWGLARISHRRPGSAPYVYHTSAGQGTCSYVIDTGVEDSHPTTDGNGHGTHVAGIIGSKSYGVAKETTIYGIKVLDNTGGGSSSGVIAGMDFVSRDAQRRRCPKGSMANMSIGGSYSKSINAAAAALVRSGVFVSVAAGGSNSDAANFSPASEPSVCTVGSTTSSDSRSSSSNYGKLVDVFAPGSYVKSTWINASSNTLSGSSMSAGHITGLGAYLAAWEGYPGAQELCTRIQSLATRGALTNIPSDTQNLLAFNGNPSG
ncbi:hypothetical protein HIM_03995 [Hirsutella minnesotensis 3608]|uniref:Cuticle-degrading protease n=1 Tax=Hirsutella minnesotensis 3608 TaxID=1043627 RepID=A0A0F8A689_9HYPO|nr:hypothetical protein HIM_03995 [Hirsutella minnesotensis 3608]